MTDRSTDTTDGPRDKYMAEMDMRVRTLADEKKTYPNFPGTAMDEADVTKAYRATSSRKCLTQPEG